MKRSFNAARRKARGASRRENAAAAGRRGARTGVLADHVHVLRRRRVGVEVRREVEVLVQDRHRGEIGEEVARDGAGHPRGVHRGPGLVRPGVGRRGETRGCDDGVERAPRGDGAGEGPRGHVAVVVREGVVDGRGLHGEEVKVGCVRDARLQVRLVAVVGEKRESRGEA